MVTLEQEVIIVGAAAAFLFLITFSIIGYLIYQVKRLKKRNNNDDTESTSDDESFTQENPNIYEKEHSSYEPSPTRVYQNPYNPSETVSIKRAKLINSLRNKIEHTPKDPIQDYGHPMSETHFGQSEDDYPHPKHGTLKNGILEARTRLKQKAPIPTPHEWAKNRPNSHEYPPKDYPVFTPKPSQPYSRQMSNPSNPKRPDSRNMQRGLTRQENEVMSQYDQTIEGFNNASRPPGFLYGNRNKY